MDEFLSSGFPFVISWNTLDIVQIYVDEKGHRKSVVFDCKKWQQYLTVEENYAMLFNIIIDVILKGIGILGGRWFP